MKQIEIRESTQARLAENSAKNFRIFRGSADQAKPGWVWIEIDDEVAQRLATLMAQKGLGTYDEAINYLLDFQDRPLAN